ncbi:hypothetical protein AB1K54_14870 [Microbacterium sp. BWT-B31]|uniref:hypothetical protein n=1 Tax=Microbacterium sp. BWT-B31 TaxID=3232072 RepID=UPI003528568C
MSLLRWLPTFLAFPLGGLLAMLLLGGSLDPLRALVAGAVVGAIVGGTQWLALGSRAGWRWLVATVVAMSGASAVAFLVFGAPVTPTAAVLTGLVTGAAVGAAQGLVLRAGVRAGVVWAFVVAGCWAIGWLVTSAVIVDIDRGHAVFGSSGAALVTLVTGVVLRMLLGRRATRRTERGAEAPQAPTATPAHVTGA